LYHAGQVSLRENVPTDSLHIAVDGNRLAAHVDAVSPLATEAPTSRYSVPRAIAHNLAGATMDAIALVRGRQGDHSCELNCEWIPGEAQAGPVDTDLLDPRDSAWSVQLEARVAGQLSEARLRTALEGVLGSAAAQRDLLDVVACEDDDALDAARARLQTRVVPPSARPPLSAHLARHPAGDVLMLNLNHAAADGFAALRVLFAIAAAYADERAPDDRLDFLAARDLPVRPASPPTPLVVRLGKRAVERVRDALARPVGLAAVQPDDEPGYGFHHVALSAEQTARVVDDEHPGTSRNVLMAALHLAIDEWNEEHGAPGRRIGVLAPANLRPEEWPEDAIGNFSVNARISTDPRERKSAAAALKAVTADTTRNKRTRTGIALIAGLQRSGLAEFWAKQSIVVLQPVTANHRADTALLCNLGSLTEAPAFGPDAGETVQLWFSLPVRSPMSLSIGAVTFDGRLHLTLRHPHALLGADAARRFADGFVRQLPLVADARDA
jgi:NRPS condensation-like uncharacterized protein